VAGREKLFLAINIVGKVRDHLNAVIANGKLAQAELKELAQVAERRKRFGILRREDFRQMQTGMLEFCTKILSV